LFSYSPVQAAKRRPDVHGKTLADTSSGNTSSGSLRDGLNAVNATTDLVNTISFQPRSPATSRSPPCHWC
jgi:hypothetical protein